MTLKNLCASDLDIAEYLDHALSTKDREAADRYLAEHEGCRSAISTVRMILKLNDDQPDTDPPEYLVNRAISLQNHETWAGDLILSLAERTLKVLQASRDVLLSYPGLVPALRANEPAGSVMVVMTKTFDDIAAEMSIEKLRGSRCNIIVSVCERASRKLARNLHIEMLSLGRLLGSGQVDDGKVQFEDVGPGSYDLVIRKRGAESGRMSLKIMT